jgi:hypothetical protein
MSFFGFDATLPKVGAGKSGGKGIFEHTNPFTEVSNARKLQALQDVEDDTYVHEFGYSCSRLTSSAVQH